MADDPQTLSKRQRGAISREGFAETEIARSPHQQTTEQPRLAPPAEQEVQPGRDDGIGEKDEVEPSTKRPVPTGNPQTESDRTDNQ